MTTYASLKYAIHQWASGDPQITAVICIGSRASTSRAISQHSDLDLIVLTPNPERLIEDTNWLSKFGPVWLIVPNKTGAGDHEWLVLYENACKVDFVISKARNNKDLTSLITDSPYAHIISEGYRMIYPRPAQEAGAMADFARISQSQPKYRPEDRAIQDIADRLLLSAVSIIQLIQRGELWRAQDILGKTLRHALLDVMACLELESEGSTPEPEGRRISSWLGPELRERLSVLFPGLSEVEIAASVSHALALFDELIRRLAANHAIEYPTEGQRTTLNWLHSQLRKYPTT